MTGVAVQMFKQAQRTVFPSVVSMGRHLSERVQAECL